MRQGEEKTTLYAGSNDLDEVGWYGEDWITGLTHGVGRKRNRMAMVCMI